jgi:hypothetical protein
MTRILTINPKQTRGLRKLLVWVNKRQYGGVVPGIYTILARDLNIAPTDRLALQLPAHAQGIYPSLASSERSRHGGQRPRWRRSLTGPAHGGRASPN